jgi:hypothetical protein
VKIVVALLMLTAAVFLGIQGGHGIRKRRLVTKTHVAHGREAVWLGVFYVLSAFGLVIAAFVLLAR